MSSKPGIKLERRVVKKGTLITREGDPGNCAYLIQSGRVQVFTNYDDREIELAELDAGEIFGEMALIFDDPRTANVRAIEPTSLIIIDRQVFEDKLNRSDTTIRAIVQMLTQRIVSANKAVVHQKTDRRELMNTARIIYENMLSALPPEQQKGFQDKTLPHLNQFLEAVQSFDQ